MISQEFERQAAAQLATEEHTGEGIEQSYGTIHERPSPLSLAKALAARAMFEGFVPLDMIESPFEGIKNELEAKIVDQSAAIEAIIEGLEASEARMPNDKRPITTLAFLGPTGVGKSETAKVLSRLMSSNPEGNLIKVDCSSYSNGHEIANLVGSPFGFVGNGAKPRLSPDRVETPGTVVLFDEIEKGSPELYNLMLQIIGDGELEITTGRHDDRGKIEPIISRVSFRDTIIILTSNLGAKEMSSQMTGSLGFGPKRDHVERPDLEKVATKSFNEFFAPEFINRLNKLVVFHPLGTEGLAHVLDIKLAEANEYYERKHGARLSLSDATRNHLIAIASEQSHLGARPLIRALEENIQSVFGRYAGSGHIAEGTHVKVFQRDEAPTAYATANDSQFIFTAKQDQTIRKEVVSSGKELAFPRYAANSGGNRISESNGTMEPEE